jgi:hypothetical protein
MVFMQNGAFEHKKIGFLAVCWFRNDRIMKMNELEWQKLSKNEIFTLMCKICTSLFDHLLTVTVAENLDQ